MPKVCVFKSLNWEEKSNFEVFSNLRIYLCAVVLKSYVFGHPCDVKFVILVVKCIFINQGSIFVGKEMGTKKGDFVIFKFCIECRDLFMFAKIENQSCAKRVLILINSLYVSMLLK